MNIAYLILAHSQPFQLVRLIERLDQPNVNFYIHVDQKSGELDVIKAHLFGYENVKIISTQDINWMGFKMVHGTLDLMQLAKAEGKDFKYYVLLSGQDYPIKTNQYMDDFFRRHNEDFISYNELAHFPDNFKDKVRFFHYFDFPYTNPRHHKRISSMVYLYFGMQKQLKKILPKRRFFKNMIPYFGSQWFALTSDTVAYILEFVKKEPGYLRFMKYTEGPDETFFPTIIMNSPRRTNLFDYDKYQKWLKARKNTELYEQEYSSLRYMDWSDRGKDLPKPAVLDEGYYETLAGSKELFARKFDEKASAALMDLIDKHLLSLNH